MVLSHWTGVRIPLALPRLASASRVERVNGCLAIANQLAGSRCMGQSSESNREQDRAKRGDEHLGYRPVLWTRTTLSVELVSARFKSWPVGQKFKSLSTSGRVPCLSNR